MWLQSATLGELCSRTLRVCPFVVVVVVVVVVVLTTSRPFRLIRFGLLLPSRFAVILLIYTAWQESGYPGHNTSSSSTSSVRVPSPKASTQDVVYSASPRCCDAVLGYRRLSARFCLPEGVRCGVDGRRSTPSEVAPPSFRVHITCN